MNKTKNNFRVGIVGCGFIGQKRASSLGTNGYLVACSDLNLDRAQKLAQKYRAKVFVDWEELICHPSVDIVIVATLHDSLAKITCKAAEAGKHVLVEKPAAKVSDELIPLLKVVSNSDVKIRVGFNHRYHRSLQKAKELTDKGLLGELMFVRARYGHGGRLDYNKEWRANPKLSGGGELIDQGPHLIDLSRWFLGDFNNIQGYANTFFWDMPVDDNSFMLLKNKKNQVAFLHVSCTEWKNLFSMEIYGKLGKVSLFGLGGSYGVEKITWYRMLPEMGPPETTTWEFPMMDNSWELEISEFYEDIRLDRAPAVGIEDAQAVLEIVESIYKESGYEHYT